jgi:hypothetical protein
VSGGGSTPADGDEFAVVPRSEPTVTTDPNVELARTIVEANAYMTLATADAEGTPWASPVWFAHDDHRDFLWVSRPGARHSRNIAGRPDVGIVIFDSTVPEGQGQAVYLSARAAEVESPVDDAIAVFSRRSVERGGDPWGAADVTGDVQFRLFRASVVEAFVLDGHDQRVPVRLDGR